MERHVNSTNEIGYVDTAAFNTEELVVKYDPELRRVLFYTRNKPELSLSQAVALAKKIILWASRPKVTAGQDPVAE